MLEFMTAAHQKMIIFFVFVFQLSSFIRFIMCISIVYRVMYQETSCSVICDITVKWADLKAFFGVQFYKKEQSNVDKKHVVKVLII